MTLGGLLLQGAIGAVVGGAMGGLGSIAGQGLKAGMSSLLSGVGARAAAQAGRRAAGQEARNIASGLTRGAIGKGAGGASARSGAADAAGGCNSFVPGTPVLLADGTSKPIEQVTTGDAVVATDPQTGESAARPVVATITGIGQKHLVEITVDSDGATGEATATVTATGTHPFWVRDLNSPAGAWVEAADLQPGQWLRTSAGTWVQITALRRWTATTQRVHNLTVAEVHTYYVTVGDASVLTHNYCPRHARGPEPEPRHAAESDHTPLHSPDRVKNHGIPSLQHKALATANARGVDTSATRTGVGGELGEAFGRVGSTIGTAMGGSVGGVIGGAIGRGIGYLVGGIIRRQ